MKSWSAAQTEGSTYLYPMQPTLGDPCKRLPLMLAFPSLSFLLFAVLSARRRLSAASWGLVQASRRFLQFALRLASASITLGAQSTSQLQASRRLKSSSIKRPLLPGSLPMPTSSGSAYRIRRAILWGINMSLGTGATKTPNTALQPTGQKLRFCPSAELRRWASLIQRTIT